MEIQAELFDEITGSTQSATGTTNPPDNDRRQHRRLPFGSRGTIAPMHGNEEGPTNVVMLRDISIGGIGFLNAEPIKIGDHFVIRFSAQSGKSLKLLCTAQRCDSGGTGGTQFVIGGTFEKLLEVTEAPSRNADPVAAPKTPAPAPIPYRKSSLFQTPKVDVAGATPEAPPAAAAAPAAVPVATPAPILEPAPAPAPAPTPEEPPAAPAIVQAPKVEETVEPAAPAPAAQVMPSPAVEAAPVSQAAASTAPKAEEKAIEPALQPIQPVVVVETVKPIETVMSTPVPTTSSPPMPVIPAVALPEAAPAAPAPIPAAAVPAPAPVLHASSIVPGKNLELVAQVKSRLLKQHEAMKSQSHQMEEVNRQLADQKAQLEELGRQRDALHAMFVKAGQQLSEEQERSSREIESLRREVLEMRETQKALQAKSDADDRAIAELAALLESEAAMSNASA